MYGVEGVRGREGRKSRIEKKGGGVKGMWERLLCLLFWGMDAHSWRLSVRLSPRWSLTLRYDPTLEM